MKVNIYTNVEGDTVKDVKKKRACLGKSESCQGTVLGYRGDRICKICKKLNERPTDASLEQDA